MTSKLNEGEVAITLKSNDGEPEPHVLKPTLKAIQVLSRTYKGLTHLHEALGNQDFDAVVNTIRVGLNLNDMQAKRLPERVFATGTTTDLILPLMRYVGILANGGKPLPDDPGQGEAAEAETASGNG